MPAINGNDGSVYADAQTIASPEYPLLWTENEGWYHPWGSAPIDGGAGLQEPQLQQQAHAGASSGMITSIERGQKGATTSAETAIETPNRKPEDLATAVARWVARGGAFSEFSQASPITI